MEVLIATLVIAVLLVVALGLAFGRSGRSLADQARHQDHLADDVDTLDYVVPEGQDPAVVVAALSVNGFDAAAVKAAVEKFKVE